MRISLYRALLLLLSLPVTLRAFFQRATGEEYDVDLRKKCLLMRKFVRNNVRITSGSNFVEHLVMATNILRIPRETEGCIVECGSYKGASTASLSLVAALSGRDLEVFDSFEGLPEPAPQDRAHRVTHWGELHTYQQGGWKGTLDEVKANITKYGDIGACHFNAGYFEETLPEFRRPAVFVFADVDLRGSLETCLEHLWPLLAEGCAFFTHEAPHMEIASLFFDRDWWKRRSDDGPPGLIGAGTGLGLIPRPGGFGSALGYAVKAPELLDLEHRPQ
jgi:O-methyltransferase